VPLELINVTDILGFEWHLREITLVAVPELMARDILILCYIFNNLGHSQAFFSDLFFTMLAVMQEVVLCITGSIGCQESYGN